MFIHRADVKAAFLNMDLEEKICFETTEKVFENFHADDPGVKIVCRML